MNAHWSFGEVTGGVWHGFRDSGMHLFGNNAFESMIREGIQNSIDAHDADSGPTVHVAFTHDDYDNEQSNSALEGLAPFLIAGYEMEQKRDKYSDESNWYKDARSMAVHSKSVPVLGLHDANTLGLSGNDNDSSEAPSPWIALVRGQGVNSKRSPESLGGFGHGSNAAFGMSSLRTVFYLSTSTDEHDLPVTRFQGHSILQTLEIEGKKTNRDGFFGIFSKGDISPLRSEHIPKWFSDIRINAVGEGKGTSTFIFAPRDAGVKDFWPALAVCVLANYAHAIASGKLRVTLGNYLEITQENVKEVFADLVSSTAIDELGLSGNLSESLESAKTIIFPTLGGNEAVPGFGQYEWFLRLDETITKPAVGVARDPGMLLSRDAWLLQSFPGYSGFDLFVCVRSGSIDKVSGQRRGGAVIIKSLEDPSHTKLSLDWVPENRRDEVKTAYTKFKNSVRELIQKQAAPKFADEIVIDIDELLGADPLGEEETTEGLTKIQVNPGKKKRPQFHQTSLSGNSGEKIGLPSGQGAGGEGGSGGNPPEGPPGGIPGLSRSIDRSPLRKMKIVPLGSTREADWTQVKLVIQAEKGGARGVTLSIAGETDNAQIAIRQDLNSEATLAPVRVEGEQTGRAEAVIWIPKKSLYYALNGEIHYGI